MILVVALVEELYKPISDKNVSVTWLSNAMAYFRFSIPNNND